MLAENPKTYTCYYVSTDSETNNNTIPKGPLT